jgi:hypothetical protein
MIINATLTRLDNIVAGEIYEFCLFTPDAIAALRQLWHMRTGTIQDPGAHKGVAVVQFIKRR